MAPDRWVIIDDTDPSIKYTGPWFLHSGNETVGNNGPPYLGTLHGTSANATLEFEFDGTGIAVIGTSIVKDYNTNPDPTFECFVDGVNIGKIEPSPFPESYWYFCERKQLLDGHHTLRIDIKVVSSDQKFWLDQLSYIPSPNLPLDNKMIWLNNIDPAILFDSQWTVFNDSNMVRQKNSTARVDFIGTSISWVGLFPADFPHSRANGTWEIDGGKETQFLLEGLPATATATVYHQFLFTTPDVEAGPHTLTVTFLGDNSTTPLCLDYLYIKNGTLPLLTSVNGTAGQESPLQGPNNPNNRGKSSLGLNAGAIIGGVLGGFALFIIIAGAILFRRHQKTRLKGNSIGKNFSEFTQTPSQHNPDNHLSSMAQVHQPHSYSPYGTSTSKAVRQALSRPVHQQTNIVRNQQEVPGPVSEAREMNNVARRSEHTEVVDLPAPSGLQATTTDTSSVRQHTDSGVRLNAEPPLDIPPQYTPD